MSEVAEEEVKELLEVTEERFESKGGMEGGVRVTGSWARVGGVSVLVGSWARGNEPPEDGDSVTELWVGDDIATSWARFSCDPSLARYKTRGDFPYDVVSLAHMCFFWGHGGSFGGRPMDE